MSANYLRRNEHQPKQGPVERPIPEEAELARACRKTIALVLATDFGTTSLKVAFESENEKTVICEDPKNGEKKTPRPLQRFEGTTVTAITAARALEARFARVYVLAGGVPEERRALEEVVSGDIAAARNRGDAHCDIDNGARDNENAHDDGATHGDENAPHQSGREVEFIPFDADAAYRATLDACGFTLYDTPKGVLDYAMRALEDNPDADSVMLIGCDQVRITPAHLLEVCRTFRDDPTLDVVASWIQWYRRTPMLISRRFLENLDASGLCEAGPNGTDRPLPRVALKDVVFGEEALAANAIVPEKLTEFEKGHTLSAHEAVQIAREEMGDFDLRAKGAFGNLQSLKQSCSHESATGTFGSCGTRFVKAPESSDASRKRDAKRSPADEELIEIARDVASRMDAWRAQLSREEQAKLAWADAWAWRNREDFPLLNDRKQKNSLVYLDSAATTQRCFRALQAEANFNEHENANVYRGGYELSKNATDNFDEARKTLEDFIGAERRQTVYTMNASASCNLVAHSWGDFNVDEGDHIVVALSEHHSDLLPWLLLARRRNAVLDFIPLLPDGRLDLGEYERLLGQHPKLVCVAHVSNVLGIVNPVADMARLAHKAGARFMLDAAQSFPHLPFNVKELGCDFAAFSAHKMYGPLGIGGLFIGKDAFDEMDPVAIGGGTVSHASVDSYYLRQGAIQYEVGTPPIAQAIGWAGAIEYMEKLGMERVFEHAEAMTPFAVHALHSVKGLTIWGDHTQPDGAGGLVSFSLANVPPAQIGSACGMMGIAIRSGGHCAMPLAASTGMVGTGRASFAVHTTCEDIEALAVAVEMCRRLYR